ncbi:activator of HSP90 ATPase [Leptospira kobayashii]|uniref:Activator of HSP90 ATPase n=1 Tax=Leptospira kobayashii TaxID=1917830 RepID=A0ABM7UMK5_9LEPT|nr:SRPBCC family protein [Leptospira kobayashii]BDA80304.1 activator of HSP90 ATPase [Leptospira kobayashii]
MHSNNTEDRTVSTTRLFDAPRELVFQMWTDPNHVGNWWGPKGFTNTIESMEVKPGGVWKFVMHGPDGVDYPNTIVYKEVRKPELLIYRHGTDMEDRPDDFHVTVTFEEEGKKTKLTMIALFQSAEARNEVVEKHGAIEGMNQTMERLRDYLGKA